jgi:hypothetical protein
VPRFSALAVGKHSLGSRQSSLTRWSTNRYFVTPYGWKVTRLFSRLEARVFRPAMAMFISTDAVPPFPLRQALDRVDTQLDLLIYEAFPLPKAGRKLDAL